MWWAQTTKSPGPRVCHGINFHANSARARANPAPNTPAGWSRVAWLGFADDEVVVVPVEVEEEEEEGLRELLGAVVVGVVPVVVVVGRVPVVVSTPEEVVGTVVSVEVPEDGRELEAPVQRPSK
jgi:hypothetical protein